MLVGWLFEACARKSAAEERLAAGAAQCYEHAVTLWLGQNYLGERGARLSCPSGLLIRRILYRIDGK